MSFHLDPDVLDEYALGTLDAAAAARAAAHLERCAACRAQYADVRAVVDVLPHALEQRAGGAELFERIAATIAGSASERGRAPSRRGAAFANPLVRALAAALVLALAGDALFALRSFGRAAQVVARVTPSPAAAAPAPAATLSPAPLAAASGAHASAPPAPPAPPATPPPAVAPAHDAMLQSEIARLANALAAEKAAAAADDAAARSQIARLERALADARGTVRIVYVTPAPSRPSPQAEAATPAAEPALVAALRTGRVFGVDGTVGGEPWHLTIVQPVGRTNALIFSGTPHAPDGQTYRTWVLRAGKTYDAGRLPPAEPTTLEMPMPLQSGDVVAFSREPLDTGDRPTQPFLMQVTISQ